MKSIHRQLKNLPPAQVRVDGELVLYRAPRLVLEEQKPKVQNSARLIWHRGGPKGWFATADSALRAPRSAFS